MDLKSVCFVLLFQSVFKLAKQRSKNLERDDNPPTCTYEELRGTWIFEVGETGFDNTIDCSQPVSETISATYKLTLDYPNVVKDDFGNTGFWTMVEAQGFEVVVHGRKFYSEIKFYETDENGENIRFCNETEKGSSHNVLGENWACFFGRKVSSLGTPKTAGELQTIKEILEREIGRKKRSTSKLSRSELQGRIYQTDLTMLVAINSAQSSWIATHYAKYDTMTMDEIISRAGSRLHRENRIMTPAPMTKEQEARLAAFPDSFDWRNVNGINYVSPVRDQGTCGSCYAFTSAAMNEARLAIVSNKTINVVLSPQDVVDCSHYTLGCDGGSSYLIGGKYGEDYGMVEESCNPYVEKKNSRCGTKSTCKRYYFTGYEFIGGYYGACNEAEMIAALVTYGPLAAGIKVDEELQLYKSGIYFSIGTKSRYNPYFEVNHDVTIVGYGVDETHGKYWIIKNSWGPDWGEEGFFRLRRGVNERGVESDAVQAFPIF